MKRVLAKVSRWIGQVAKSERRTNGIVGMLMALIVLYAMVWLDCLYLAIRAWMLNKLAPVGGKLFGTRGYKYCRKPYQRLTRLSVA